MYIKSKELSDALYGLIIEEVEYFILCNVILGT